MLIVTRKPGELRVIRGGARLTALGSGQSGVDRPRDMAVHCEQYLARVQDDAVSEPVNE